MRVGSLFSGIGGLDLGLEQAGMNTVWQVENDDWARERLSENFPHTEKYKDVREVGKHNLEHVDLICGGFPCQDVSQLNPNGKGLDGERSGLWSEYYRIICELRPSYALIENVAKLAVFGLHRVLSDLAGVGYDAQWKTLYASDFGLPTHRKRLFIVAFPKRFGFQTIPLHKGNVYQNGKPREISKQFSSVFIQDIRRAIVEIPEHLRMDNGLSFELSEIERAVKGYGNAVAPPVARFLGEQILRFDKEINCQKSSPLEA